MSPLTRKSGSVALACALFAMITTLFVTPIKPAYAAQNSIVNGTFDLGTDVVSAYATKQANGAITGAPLSSSIALNTPSVFYVNVAGAHTLMAFSFTLTVGSGSVTSLVSCPPNMGIVGGSNTCSDGSGQRSMSFSLGVATRVAQPIPGGSWMAFQIKTSVATTYTVSINAFTGDILGNRVFQ